MKYIELRYTYTDNLKRLISLWSIIIKNQQY